MFSGFIPKLLLGPRLGREVGKSAGGVGGPAIDRPLVWIGGALDPHPPLSGRDPQTEPTPSLVLHYSPKNIFLCVFSPLPIYVMEMLRNGKLMCIEGRRIF